MLTSKWMSSPSKGLKLGGPKCAGDDSGEVEKSQLAQ